MACYVFGNPITNSTLAGMPEYAGKTIKCKDRARVAYNMKNAESKDINARRYVENLRKESDGTDVFTLCLVYNATGEAITYATHKDWNGHIGQAPYPVEIANGQWGAFLHVGISGSNAGVVYRIKNENGQHDCDWMSSWSNPSSGPNHAYSEIREVNHFGDLAWPIVKGKLDDAGYVTTEEWAAKPDYKATVCIGRHATSVYEAIITMKN